MDQEITDNNVKEHIKDIYDMLEINNTTIYKTIDKIQNTIDIMSNKLLDHDFKMCDVDAMKEQLHDMQIQINTIIGMSK